jgi:hypothetical protein
MSMSSNSYSDVRKQQEKDETSRSEREHLDPISGAPGAHPVGTGIGAVTGGAAGLGIGAALGGPIGAVIGIAAGAIAGGLGGKEVAEQFDPTVEESYWRDRYLSRPYVRPDEPFDIYLPAYRLGWEHRSRTGRSAVSTFEDVEAELAKEWDSRKRTSQLEWSRARLAARDAWSRSSVERAENEGMPPQRGDPIAVQPSPSPGRSTTT